MEKSRIILVSFFRWNWTNRYTNASANMVGKLKTPNAAVKIAPIGRWDAAKARRPLP